MCMPVTPACWSRPTYTGSVRTCVVSPCRHGGWCCAAGHAHGGHTCHHGVNDCVLHAHRQAGSTCVHPSLIHCCILSLLPREHKTTRLQCSPAQAFYGCSKTACHKEHIRTEAPVPVLARVCTPFAHAGHLPGVGKLSGTAVSFTDLLLGFVLAASNAVAGILTDMTRTSGYGNTGCFAGGALACVAAGALLMVFERWGDLGKDELVMGKASRKKAQA